MEILLYLLLVCVAGGAYAGIVALVDRLQMARRMNLALGGVSESAQQRSVAEGMSSVGSRLIGVVGAMGGLVPLGEEDRRKIASSLQRGGFRSQNALAIMLGLKFACLLTGLALGLVFLTPLLPGLFGWGLGIVGGFLGGILLNILPEVLLARFGLRRLYRIEAALPEAFDLLIVCLESGLTFERALERTAGNMRSFQPELSKEFGFALLGINVYGRTREEALGQLAGRLDSQTLKDFATTVAQSERHGTPMAAALRNLARSLRVETMSRIQARMARLPTLLLFPSIGFVLPGLVVIVGGPAVVQLTQSLGQVGGGL